jgi:hypothetical protein
LLNVVASTAADLAAAASEVLPSAAASEALPSAAGSEVLLSAQAFVAPPSVQAFVAQPSVQGSALARLGHASAPPRSRQAFGAEALALGIRS